MTSKYLISSCLKINLFLYSFYFHFFVP